MHIYINAWVFYI